MIIKALVYKQLQAAVLDEQKKSKRKGLMPCLFQSYESFT